jgi:hypothetical protein
VTTKRGSQPEVQAEGVVQRVDEVGRELADDGAIRSTAIDRTCSACAFESRARWQRSAGSSTWNG